MTTLFNTRSIRSSRTSDYLRGVGSILNISGKTHREYNFAESDKQADRNAMADDWAVVGADLAEALSAATDRD